MKPGIFIVIEGIDGSGKGIQSKLLYNWLKKKGQAVWLTREPTLTTELGEIVRSALKYGKIKPGNLALLFATDRAFHSNDIEKKIKEGVIVISDRYYYSSLAYQGAQGLDEKWLKSINKFSLKPDVVLYLDISPDLGLKRISSNESLRSITKEKEYLEKKKYLKIVRKNYTELALNIPFFFTIDADKPVKNVQSDMRRVIGRFFKNISKKNPELSNNDNLVNLKSQSKLKDWK
jgi:dTMP kinase